MTPTSNKICPTSILFCGGLCHQTVYRLIQRKSDLKEYYSSVFSSFKVENGNYIHQEDQEFLNKVIETIDKNIANPVLSVELLSSELGYSTRQFYRKLKPITEKFMS